MKHNTLSFLKGLASVNLLLVGMLWVGILAKSAESLGQTQAQGQTHGQSQAQAQAAQAQAQSQTQGNPSLVEKTVEVTVEEENPNLAKKLLIDKANEKVSEDMIREIIGEQKYARNKALIQSRIVKNSIRYIPFSKSSEVLPSGKGFKLIVNMKVNQADLQKVLLENGLFYESDMAPILIPTFYFDDRIQSRQWGWWYGSNPKMNDLMKLSRILETQLKSSFLKNNFYFIRAQALHYSELMNKKTGIMSAVFSDNQMDLQSWQKTVAPWNVQILLSGEIALQKSPKSEAFQIAFKLSAIQTQNSREIASFVRTYDTDIGQAEVVIERKMRAVVEQVANEISGQVLDAWQKGTIGASLFRLAVNGKIPLPLQDSLKEYLKNQLREVKDIKERVITADQIVYEIDSSLAPKDILAKSPTLKLPGYVLKGEGADEYQIEYKIMKEAGK